MDEGQRGIMEAELDQSRIDAREALARRRDRSWKATAMPRFWWVRRRCTCTPKAKAAVSRFLRSLTMPTSLLIHDASLSAPSIIDAMRGAGFVLGDQPGLFSRDERHKVDLLVPAAVGGAGRRGARLGVHGTRAAMKVHGLEGALVSHDFEEDPITEVRVYSHVRPESGGTGCFVGCEGA